MSLTSKSQKGFITKLSTILLILTPLITLSLIQKSAEARFRIFRSPSSYTSYQQEKRQEITGLQICNKTNRTLQIAIAIYSNSSGWQSWGWFDYDPGCELFTEIGKYEGDVYLFAMDKNGNHWKGEDASFCINIRSHFSIPHSNQSSCYGSDFKKARMNGISVEQGELSVFTFH